MRVIFYHQVQQVLQVEALNDYPPSLSSKHLLRALARRVTCLSM